MGYFSRTGMLPCYSSTPKLLTLKKHDLGSLRQIFNKSLLRHSQVNDEINLEYILMIIIWRLVGSLLIVIKWPWLTVANPLFAAQKCINFPATLSFPISSCEIGDIAKVGCVRSPVSIKHCISWISNCVTVGEWALRNVLWALMLPRA